ncbi:hypothetical protein ACSHWG_05715 [Leucobacter sp. Z1108]|uniref:hypothetical protein n=1 Tax=Leucobacter sp. Z1108 TaxID=3439066 RepID=UPI003F366473
MRSRLFPIRSVAARAATVGIVTAVLVGTAVGAAGTILQVDPASANETASAVTLSNANDALNPEGAPFPDLQVTISQTKDLVSQGIRVTWTGGKRSSPPASTVGGANFLQIAQCWGEDPENPGHPDRRTCQYGGTLGWGSTRDGNTEFESVAEQDLRFTAPALSELQPTYTGIPFVAVNAEKIVDETLAPADRVVSALKWNETTQTLVQRLGADFVDLNTNPFFTEYTTNEVRWAPSGLDGSGSVPFEVQTAMQSPGLGCGTPESDAATGAVAGQSCWLVVIPRGTGDSGAPNIERSGLWWDAWEHHLAVKLDFKPLGVRCTIGAPERQLAGSELISAAVSSWQPKLCAGESGAAFVLGMGNEADALVKASKTAASPLALSSFPLNTEVAGVDQDPLAYAPIAIAGVAISFSIDREPHPQNATADEKLLARLPMSEMKLTPRLVAKLLTASYRDALPSGTDLTHIGYESGANPGKNARTIIQDPDFLQHNGGPDGEWAHQIVVGASVADALLPSGRSDLATQLWNYVKSDPEAAAWLNGTPDEWGMVVNPWYSTNTEVNPNGVPFNLPRDNFPKADPVEKADTTVTDPANGTGAVNLVTFRPYTHDFENGAYDTLRGDGLILGEWDRFSTPQKYRKQARELFGSQKVIALTTTPAAALYQTVTASLRNPAGQFVAPTPASLAAGAAAMVPNATQPKVLGIDFTASQAKGATTAYPLTMPVYAALNPLQSDAQLRATYANLIRYAVQEGQTPGTDLGQLPPGYTALPGSWIAQAVAAAGDIEQGVTQVKSASTSTAGASNPAPRASAPAAVAAATAAPTVAADPAATGAGTGALVGKPTPEDPKIGPVAAAVPAGLTAGLAAAAAVPLIGRIRRRA